MGNNVVAYCRVSTDKEDQINSFIAQQEFFKKYAEQNNLNLIRIYADEGITNVINLTVLPLEIVKKLICHN